MKMSRGTTTRCFPRWDFQDPVPRTGRRRRPRPHGEGRQARPPYECARRSAQFEAGWLRLYDKGPDGLYMFNRYLDWTTLRRMGHIDEVRARVASGQVQGIIERPTIEFIDQK